MILSAGLKMKTKRQEPFQNVCQNMLWDEKITLIFKDQKRLSISHPYGKSQRLKIGSLVPHE